MLLAGPACNVIGPGACTLIGCTGLVELTEQPAYQLTRPNGPECPPECRSARVTVAL
jgi:hypothetical protein